MPSEKGQVIAVRKKQELKVVKLSSGRKETTNITTVHP